MKFSKLTDYAVLVLSALDEGAAQSASASALAKDTGVPEPTVSKVLKLLSRHGLVQAQRGVNGGYILTRPLREISVLDALTAVEGRLTMTECLSGDGESSCSLEAFCALNGRWTIVNKAVENTLNNISLAEMAQPQSKPHVIISKEPKQVERAEG